MMGGGPPEETLLFVHHEDEPKHITDAIRKEFPYVNLVFHRLVPSASSKSTIFPFTGEEIPDSLWQQATILVTLFILPPRPDLVPNLRWIQILSAGIDHLINHPIYKDTQIPITTASGIHGPAIAEWILMTSLDLSKNYNLIHDNQKEHKWDSRGVGLLQRRDWYGRTIGIAGYGSIGRQAARVFNAMGCKVHVYTASTHSTPQSRQDNGYIIPGTGDPDGTIPEAWYSGSTKTELHTFLSSGLDLLVISVPLTPATTGLFGTEEFDVLHKASFDKVKQQPGLKLLEDNELPPGEGCIISNVSRGGVINQPALTQALKDNKLQGAALDVTDPEPLPADSELWVLKNVIISPHLSGHFSNYADRAFDIVAENLRRRERGSELVNLVRRDKGY